jgi:threonylcarbamoyladenosine tRNA methylthiotransferase MtaB
MKYSIITFGCRVNQADSLRMEEEFRSRGGRASAPADADVVVVNTCSVTATADQGARQTIRRLARDNPALRLVVTGCYATRCEADVAELPNVVQVVRNHEKDGLVARVMDGDGPCGAPIEPGVAGRTAFTLRVQTGCEAHCAYCIIPSTRGPGRSLPVEQVVAEVQRVAHAGFKEIALTGVHLGSYGRDLPSHPTFTDLMQSLLELKGPPPDLVFRISSLEPMDCPMDLVALVSSSGGRIAPHFHLPLQHANDHMLTAMRRPYTLAYYRRLVDRIQERLPHASIGSDMIVGFPGESDEHFASNLDYLPSSPLTHLHVFPYSDRPGTEATAMREKVDGRIVRERGATLRRIGAELTRRFHAGQAGTTRPALTLEDGTLVVTDNYLKVRIPPGLARNQRVNVRITDVTGSLSGVVEPSRPNLAEPRRTW